MAVILVVEDKESMAQMLSQALQAEGHQVIVGRDGREGLEKFKESKVDLVVSDLKLPHKSGLEVLEVVKEHNPLIPVILMTAYGTIETAVKAVKEGAYDFITKPFDPDHLIHLINKALEKQRLVTENLILREEFSKHLKLPKIIGKSPKMLEVVGKVQKVAASHTTVLLLGESGTGKELFARAVHYLSPRKEGPFVAINCAAIPRDLLESELFGHERGAFTGAVVRKMGKFELANQGTIFLDEIGDMDLALQAKLLRVLEGEEFMRVGGTVKIKVDVRVIAATNKDLQAAISQKLFREDLYYRLAVFPVTIPPLRARAEDIPALVEHFVGFYCQELKKEPKEVAPASMELLIKHPWTGNVRELQNCIERAVILSDGRVLLPEHLGLRVKATDETGLADLQTEGSLQEVSHAATQFAESRMIRKVLKETGGNKSRAAEILKVSYKTLLTKIKDYGIEG
ncbi:MAG TPA: sigma-54 dependent transcriptional regulator [Nitrospiria bacterium]|jgi:DNA-binding NtrC family response regulator|nr:sigma-54 dependent transcriptional regulator [Nitrospiria bacterium]